MHTISGTVLSTNTLLLVATLSVQFNPIFGDKIIVLKEKEIIDKHQKLPTHAESWTK